MIVMYVEYDDERMMSSVYVALLGKLHNLFVCECPGTLVNN